ncbi:MAG: hypothetical protein JXR76_30950 [Deltaproteobacteria bacterium]|nr:hypothetical protein [Deltaproteobacteria bacterium]
MENNTDALSENGMTVCEGFSRIPARLENHIVIININEKLPVIVDEIFNGWRHDTYADIVVFVQDQTLWDSNPRWHPKVKSPHRLFVVQGCPGNTDQLKCTGVDTCRTAVILADPSQGRLSDAKGTLIALAIEQVSPDVHTVIEVVSSGHRVHLKGTEVNEAVCMGELTEALLAQNVISPGVLKTVEELMAIHNNAPGFMLKEIPEAMVGMTYREAVLKSIEEGSSFVICGYEKNAREANGMLLIHHPTVNPTGALKDTVLCETDAFVVLDMD